MNTARFVSIATAIAAVLILLASSIPGADATVDMGTERAPLNSLSIDTVTAYEAYAANGPFYVKVGGSVRVTPVADDLEIVGFTQGFGMSDSNGSMVGTLSKAGELKVELADLIYDDVIEFFIIAVDPNAEPQTCTITYASSPANGGDISLQTATVAKNSTASVNGNAITIGGKTATATAKSGYAFIGWSAPTGAIASNQTVTANFVAVGTLQAPLESLSLTTAQAMHLGDITKFYVRAGGSVSIPNIAADGYELTFVSVNPSGSGLRVNNGVVGTLTNVQTNTEYSAAYNWTDTHGGHGTGTAKIVAVSGQAPTNVTVSFSAAGGTVTPAWLSVASGSDITASGNTITIGDKTATAAANASYRFAGWEGLPSDGKAAEDLTITARFVAVPAGTAVISYFDGSTLVGIQSVAMPATGTAKATIAQPTSVAKDGYTLKGWAIAGDESGKLVADGEKVDVPSGGLSLTAVWEKNSSWVDYVPYAIAIIGIILAIVGFMFNPILIVAGVAVAVLGALEALGWINLI